jgi:hypothetical protein
MCETELREGDTAMTRQAYISDEAVVRRANAAVRIELEKKERWIFRW